MWLSTKLAAGKKRRLGDPSNLPELSTVQNELGNVNDAILYRQLITKHPEIERGFDQTIADHFTKLKRAEQEFQASGNPDAERRTKAREKGILRTPVLEDNPTQPWVGQLPTGPSGPDLKGMPQRIPGWYTGDALDKAPAGYGTPPMSQRVPGARYAPNYTPDRPTYEQWVQGLANKGIFLDPDGRRMTPEQMQLPHRPVRGRDIWENFTRPAPLVGRHRAAKVVVAYFNSVLGSEEDPVDRWWKRHNAMLGAGWDFHESGSGNWYEKNIGGKTHRIMGEKDGWTHYADGETPKFYPELRDALLHAHRGQMQVGFRPPPIHQQSLSSWSDEQ